MNETKNEMTPSFVSGEIRSLGDNAHVKSIW
jgi:hypothetical protein